MFSLLLLRYDFFGRMMGVNHSSYHLFGLLLLLQCGRDRQQPLMVGSDNSIGGLAINQS